MAIERLSYSGYQPVGTVIGEASGIGSTNANTDKHVLAIPGRGSRYILEKNTSLTRGYIYNEPLSFSSTAPHTAPLQSTANGSTASATLVDSEGIEVRKDFWRFGSDNVTIIIGDPAFDPTKSYFLSYQSSDRTVADPIPTDSIRTIAAVGSQIDQDSYTRNVDYFIDTAVLPPVAAVDGANTVIQQTNPSATFSTIAHVGTGTAVASISTSALFTHLYSRGYALEVVDVTGTVVTFEWKSNPIEKGNGSAPSTPLVAGLQAPTFTIDTSKPQTLTVDLEFGVRIDFTSTGTYVEGDTFSFSVYGPSLVEVASALTNTNQFASASTVVPSVDNNGAGSIVVDAELYALTKNTNVVLEVTDVDEGVVVATVPSGEIRFTDVNPNDGASFSIDNGISGSGKVVSTFEFDGNSVVTAGSSKITLGTTAAVAATGSITFVGSASDAPDDGDYVTIIDGNRTLVFEFDINGSLNNAGAIRVLIDTTAGSQSKNTAANLVTAINASLLNVAAADVSSSNGNVGKLTLVHNVAGSNGNNAILSSTQAIAVFGFSGGKNITSNIATTKTNTINAINDVTPRIGVVAYADDSDTTSIKLVHGARFVFAGLPTADDTITINSGTSTETYVFKATAALPDEITIAGTVALTLTNIVTALDASTLNVAAVASTAGGLSTLTIASKIARNVTLTKSSTNISVVSSIIDNAAALSNGNVAIAYTGSNYSVTGLVGGVDAQDSPDIITFAYGTSGDAFASGVFSIAEGYSEGKYVSLYGGAKIKLGSAIATKAEGFITLHSLPADSDTITINDGIAPVTLTFKTTASLATDVQIVSGDIATTTNNLLSKIASQPLYVDGSKTSTNTIKLVHRKTGATYNNAITFTGTALTVAGLAGGASNYVAGDRYSFTLLAPRKFTTALDDRKVTLTVGTVGIETPDVSDHGYVLFSFSSDTPEGGWGDVEATSANDGYFTLPGQIALVARNTHANISTNGNNLNRFVTGDKFTVVYINNNTIIWTLDKKATESKESADVLFDRNGSVTGKAATYYVVLKNKPYAGTIKVTNAGVAYTGWSLLAGTNIIVLSVKSASAVSGMMISYTHAGSEPSLGSSYYVTANYLRPIEYYNEPRVFYGREEALAFVAPVTADNDLAIGINIVYDQEVAPQAIAIVQIRDSDDDGVFSPADIDTALSHCAGVNYITEFVPLRLSQYLDKFLAFNVQRNDPFAKSEHIFGYGAPIGTPVGSELDEGSLIFTARRTLQVYGNSPAHGKRFMIASTRARKKTTLTDGTVINPYLDGSFIALAIAGKICGQNNNDSTILNTNILGFNEVEVFNDATNRLLGGASIIYLENNGTNVYRLKEDVTVDDSRSDYHEILSVRTKIDATRTVRRECDRQIIGFVPPTKAAGVATIKAKIIGILNAMVANGTIAPYQDSEGNARRILPTDVNVIRDENDPTLFHFTYWFFTKSAVKRLLGLYSVNENVFTPQA